MAVSALLVVARPSGAWSQSSVATDDAQAYQQAVDRGIMFLKAKAQGSDGSYFAKGGPGVTALVSYAIMHHGRSPDDPMVAKSLKYLEGFVQPDGGYTNRGGTIPTTRLAWPSFASPRRTATIAMTS
jgi:squalene-hopene/tetraprenyl-beta-curcumene cyclase